MRSAAVLLLVACVLFAGCNGEKVPAVPIVTIGLITPDVWKVTGATDHILVWIRNDGSTKVDVRWDLEQANGTALPSNWTLTRTRDEATLQPHGTKTRAASGYSYPDWEWSLLTLAFPPGTPTGETALQIDAGPATHRFTLRIDGTSSRVSGVGDKVSLHYDGRFVDTGERFDDGEFQTGLGSGQTVPGFDYGLIGLSLHEKASLFIPAALAYGYDNTNPPYTKFNGRTLRFDVEILSFDG